MAKGGDEDNPATWPPEGLPIKLVFLFLFPIAWASYDSAKRKAYSDLQQLSFAVGSDTHRRVEAYHDAKNELEVELRRLLESQGFERWELWGRLESPLKDAQPPPCGPRVR